MGTACGWVQAAAAGAGWGRQRLIDTAGGCCIWQPVKKVFLLNGDTQTPGLHASAGADWMQLRLQVGVLVLLFSQLEVLHRCTDSCSAGAVGASLSVCSRDVVHGQLLAGSGL